METFLQEALGIPLDLPASRNRFGSEIVVRSTQEASDAFYLAVAAGLVLSGGMAGAIGYAVTKKWIIMWLGLGVGGGLAGVTYFTRPLKFTDAHSVKRGRPHAATPPAAPPPPTPAPEAPAAKAVHLKHRRPTKKPAAVIAQNQSVQDLIRQANASTAVHTPASHGAANAVEGAAGNVLGGVAKVAASALESAAANALTGAGSSGINDAVNSITSFLGDFGDVGEG